MIDTLSILLRALGFVAIFQAAGMAIFLFVFERWIGAAVARSLRRLGVAAGLVALAAVAGHFSLEPARMGGALSAIADPGLRQIVLDSPLAAAFACRIGGIVLLIAGLAWWSSPARALALLGALGALTAFTLTGHTASFSPRLLLAALLLVHIGIAAFWFGSLLPLRRIALQESPANAGRVIEAFSKVALILVPLLAAAGTALAVLFLGSWGNLASAYGRLILVKIALFGLLMVLAAMNRWRYGPRLARGARGAGRAFARTVLTEYILIAGVLATTAALTTLYSPDT
jgi:putative copper resistance protein D